MLALTHLVLTAASEGKRSNGPYFMNGKQGEAQGGYQTCPGSHSIYVVEPGFELCNLEPNLLLQAFGSHGHRDCGRTESPGTLRTP